MSTEITLIEHEMDVAKLVAYLRARVRRKQFQIANDLLEFVVASIQQWAREIGLKVMIRVVRPDATTVLVLGACGATAGAIAGFWLTGAPAGAGVGAAAGLALGAAAACIRISVRTSGSGGAAVLELE